MAAVTSGNQKLYVVEVEMSSPFFIKRSEKYADENAKKSWFKYDEDNRKKIQAIRQGVNTHLDMCARFHKKLKIANDLTKEQITEAVRKADAKMKSVDPELKAEVTFVELEGGQFSSGTMLEKLTNAIREQVIGVTLKKIEAQIKKNAGEGLLTPQNKKTLIKALERCKGINIVNDQSIDDKIESMKEQINSGQILELRTELMTMLNTDTGRFSSIDMFSQAKADDTTEAVVQVEETDEDREYDAHPESAPSLDTPVNSRFDVM